MCTFTSSRALLILVTCVLQQLDNVGVLFLLRYEQSISAYEFNYIVS